jgi:predicted lactoylglutathione lyase
VGGSIAGFLALAGKDVICIAHGVHLQAKPMVIYFRNGAYFNVPMREIQKAGEEREIFIGLSTESDDLLFNMIRMAEKSGAKTPVYQKVAEKFVRLK